MSTSDRLARSLLLYAARSAPPPLAERLREEWLADFETRPPGLGRLRLALGCCWATQVITRDCRATGALVAASGNSGVLAQQPDRAHFSSRRAVALALIACLHVGLIWMLATGLLQRTGPAPLPHTDATFLPPTAPPLPPPLPDPTLKGTTIESPLPPGDVKSPPPDEAAISGTITEPPAPPTPSATHAVSRVWGGPGRGFPSTGDFYPAAAIRSGVEGGATLRVCVAENGRLSGVPAIEQSSGSALLDAAALKLASAGSGHYRPTTDDGRPVSSCYALRVRFELR